MCSGTAFSVLCWGQCQLCVCCCVTLSATVRHCLPPLNGSQQKPSCRTELNDLPKSEQYCTTVSHLEHFVTHPSLLRCFYVQLSLICSSLLSALFLSSQQILSFHLFIFKVLTEGRCPSPRCQKTAPQVKWCLDLAAVFSK